VPLFLEVRDFMLFRLGKRRQKSRGPLKKPQEMADYVFFPTKKHKIPNFENQWYYTVHWYFYVPLNRAYIPGRQTPV
jgi:hypothetical protein